VKITKFRPNADNFEYQFKKQYLIRWLQDGIPVKVHVQFRGHETAQTNLSANLLLRLAGDVARFGIVEGVSFDGPFNYLFIRPVVSGPDQGGYQT
jgi:translation initiation factor IF-3